MAAQNNAPSAAERQADKSADDAYLAAVSALLTAMATDSRILDEEAEVLADSMPDVELSAGLMVWLRHCGLLRQRDASNRLHRLAARHLKGASR